MTAYWASEPYQMHGFPREQRAQSPVSVDTEPVALGDWDPAGSRLSSLPAQDRARPDAAAQQEPAARAWLRNTSPLWAQLPGPNGPPRRSPQSRCRAHICIPRGIHWSFLQEGKGKEEAKQGTL